DGGELHAVVVPAAQVLARHAGGPCGAVVARRAGRAAAPATDGITNGLAEAAPAAQLSGLLLRVGDAATPGPAGVKVPLCYHVSLLCLRMASVRRLMARRSEQSALVPVAPHWERHGHA